MSRVRLPDGTTSRTRENREARAGEAPPIDVVRVEEAAYSVSVRANAAEMASFVIATVGQRRAAAALGLKDARPLKGWSEGSAIKERAVGIRLRVLYRITYAIASTYSAETAAAFLESTSPYLSDRSPLAVLATTDPVEDAEVAVVSAARALLDG